MTKNITLRIDEALLRKLKYQAVDKNASLSSWVIKLLNDAVEHYEQHEIIREEALKTLEKGFHLGGQPLSRDQTHVR